MAIKPCSVGTHRNPLRSNYYYVTVAHQTENQSGRLRLCPTHSRVAQEYLTKFEVNPEDGALSGGEAAESECLSCRKPVGELDWKVFITCYPAKDQRKDYWTNIHVDCSLPESMSLSWADPL